MNSLLEVRSGPAYYACRANVLDTLDAKLSKGNIGKVLIIHGEKSWKAAQPFFPSLKNIETTFFTYSGECSDSEIERVQKAALELGVDASAAVSCSTSPNRLETRFIRISSSFQLWLPPVLHGHL
ncbi:hypothetical protein [Peribacillus sp. NPDC060253]|uniref:hypothetical protein n=1 Tax=Peribacillus sp. NPDC060253 TaxID=3347084 RepID=UPI0036566F89